MATANQLPGDVWNSVFATHLWVGEGLWEKIKPLDTFEGYHRKYKFSKSPAGLEHFMAEQNAELVARFDEIVGRMNSVIGDGVKDAKQGNRLKPLIEELRVLIYETVV